MVFREAPDQIKFLQYVQRSRDVAGLQKNSSTHNSTLQQLAAQISLPGRP